MSEEQTTQEKMNKKGLLLGLLTTAMFMVVIDFSIVQIALPTIKNQFNISIESLQWVVTAYGLTYAGFLMLSGRAADYYGRKKLFILGLLLFSAASFCGGLAPTEQVLVAARAVQGIGAAVGSATSLSIITATFAEGPERNRALSIFSAVLSSGFAIGVVLGGYMTASLGWRSVLLVNVPIGIVSAILASKYLKESKETATHKHLDISGAVCITSGLMLLVYGLTSVEIEGPASTTTLVSLMLAAALLLSFLIVEYRSPAPLMPLSFLRRGGVLPANVLALISSFCIGGLIFILTILLQQVFGYSPLDAGISFLPMAFMFIITSGYLSARLVDRFGTRAVLLSGMSIVTLGFLLLVKLPLGSGFFQVLPAMVVISFGGGIGWTAINIAALEGAQVGEEGLASGVFNTSIQTGGPLGLAVLLTVSGIRTANLAGSGAPTGAEIFLGFQFAFVVSAALTLLGVIIAFLIKEKNQSQRMQPNLSHHI